MSKDDLDYLCFVVLKNGTEKTPFTLDDGEIKSLIINEPRLIFEFQKVLNKQFKYNHGYLYTSYQSDEVFIQEAKSFYQIHFRGYFFLFPDYKNKLTSFIQTLKDLKYYYHLTRLDYAFTLDADFQDFSKHFTRAKTNKELTTSQYKKAGAFNYLAIFNSRMKVVAYDKQKALKQKKVKNEYRSLYRLKYGQATTRVEIRLFQKDTLKGMSSLLEKDPALFFHSYQNFVINYFTARVKLKKGLLFKPQSIKDSGTE